MSSDDIRKSPLDDEGSKNFFNQIKKMWIEPELNKRLENGSINASFEVKKCLIKFPPEGPPIVQFNKEAGWIAMVKKDHGSSFQKGDGVHVYQIDKILSVEPPKINGKRVGFVFLHLVEDNWETFFDFSPNHPGWKESAEDKEWVMGKMIAESLQKVLVEQTVKVSPAAQSMLNEIGLWVAPSLLPYPLSMIMKKLLDKDKVGAIKLLVNYCNAKFIDETSKKWWSVKQFKERKELLEDALKAHKETRYSLSISALLPQLEGIITDWVVTKSPPDQIPFRQDSKTKKFRDLILDDPVTPVSFKIIINSAIEFILSGPVLSKFQRWLDNINTAFPNRHVVGHGKYDSSIFSEENSIKLILLIDTIYYIILSKDGSDERSSISTI